MVSVFIWKIPSISLHVYIHVAGLYPENDSLVGLTFSLLFYFISCSNLVLTLLFISCCWKLRLDSRLCPFTWPLSLLAISAICISHAHQHHKWEPSTFVHIIMERMIRDLSAVNIGLSYRLLPFLFSSQKFVQHWKGGRVALMLSKLLFYL